MRSVKLAVQLTLVAYVAALPIGETPVPEASGVHAAPHPTHNTWTTGLDKLDEHEEGYAPQISSDEFFYGPFREQYNREINKMGNLDAKAMQSLGLAVWESNSHGNKEAADRYITGFETALKEAIDLRVPQLDARFSKEQITLRGFSRQDTPKINLERYIKIFNAFCSLKRLTELPRLKKEGSPGSMLIRTHRINGGDGPWMFQNKYDSMQHKWESTESSEGHKLEKDQLHEEALLLHDRLLWLESNDEYSTYPNQRAEWLFRENHSDEISAIEEAKDGSKVMSDDGKLLQKIAASVSYAEALQYSGYLEESLGELAIMQANRADDPEAHDWIKYQGKPGNVPRDEARERENVLGSMANKLAKARAGLSEWSQDEQADNPLEDQQSEGKQPTSEGSANPSIQELWEALRKPPQSREGVDPDIQQLREALGMPPIGQSGQRSEGKQPTSRGSADPLMQKLMEDLGISTTRQSGQQLRSTDSQKRDFFEACLDALKAIRQDLKIGPGGSAFQMEEEGPNVSFKFTDNNKSYLINEMSKKTSW